MIYSKLFKFLFFLLLTTNCFSQVTVSTEVEIDNVITNSINFNGDTSVSFTLYVNMETTNNDFNNVFGNLFIYIKDAVNTEPIPIAYGSPVFDAFPDSQGKYKSTNNIFPFDLETSYFQSEEGRILYVEYVNNQGQKYKSSEIEVIDVTPPTSLKRIFRASKILYLDTADRVENDSDIVYMNINHQGVSFSIEYALKNSATLVCGDTFDYWIMESDNFHIARREENYAQIPSTPCPVVTDTVKGDLPYIWISNNEFKNKYGINFRHISTHRGGISAKKLRFKAVRFANTDISLRYYSSDSINPIGVNTNRRLSISISSDDNPFLMEIVPASRFDWFKRSGGSDWILTSEPTESDFDALTETTEYFRRVVFKGAYQDSNILSVNPRNIDLNLLNTICCDQALPNGSSVATLTGNYLSSLVFDYSWQIYSRFNWAEVANTRNYTPPAIPERTRIGEYPKRYRRVVRNKLTNRISYSNEVIISVASGRPALKVGEKDYINEIQLYPNPTSSVLYIEYNNNLETENISVYDISGRKLSDYIFNVLNENKIEVDISKFQNGVYLLVLGEGENQVIKRFVKN